MSRDPIDNADQPPEVDVHDPEKRMPAADAAAERIIKFVSWFGDGEVIGSQLEDAKPPLYARDLEAVSKHALGLPKPVEDFINERSEYVSVCRATVDADADYYRWQGHMEARRQLSNSLGYTVPYEPGEKTVKVQKDEGADVEAA